jgi:hypothetical protein
VTAVDVTPRREVHTASSLYLSHKDVASVRIRTYPKNRAKQDLAGLPCPLKPAPEARSRNGTSATVTWAVRYEDFFLHALS